MPCWIAAELGRSEDGQLLVGITIRPHQSLKLRSLKVVPLGLDDEEIGECVDLDVPGRILKESRYTVRLMLPPPARIRCVALPEGDASPVMAVVREAIHEDSLSLPVCLSEARSPHPGQPSEGGEVSEAALAELEGILEELEVEDDEGAFQMFVNDFCGCLPDDAPAPDKVEGIFRDLFKLPEPE